MRRTPHPGCLTRRLCVRRPVRTAWLWCHEVVSHTRRRARFPRPPKRSPHQAGNGVVRPRTGCPVAPRRPPYAGVGGVARTSRPPQANAGGSRAAGGRVFATKGNACASGAQVCRVGGARPLHQTAAPQPSAHAGWIAARRLRRSRGVCSGVRWVGTGAPARGASPPDAKPSRRHAVASAGVPGGAHRLLVAPEGCGAETSRRSTAAGQPDVTAAPGHTVAISSPRCEPPALVGRTSTNTDRVAHEE